LRNIDAHGAVVHLTQAVRKREQQLKQKFVVTLGLTYKRKSELCANT
jgi:dihydroneopterin aldolase